jgi:hypothetical protein
MVLNKFIDGTLYYELAFKKAYLPSSIISLIGSALVDKLVIYLLEILHNSINNFGPGFLLSFILIAKI